MAIEAKRAAKLEKKLKTLLGGYQVNFIEFIKDSLFIHDFSLVVKHLLKH
jgi:hypothetical protein